MTTLGCYGSVIANSKDSETCKKCNLANACFELVKENTEKIKNRLAVDVSKQERRQHQQEVELGNVSSSIIVSGKRETLTDYQQSIVNNPHFSIKARKLLSSLFRKGITGTYLRRMLIGNVNPFSNSTPAIFDVACELILNGKMSKQNLRTSYVGLGQSDKTALAQVNTVLTCFLLMGVLTKDLKLRDKQ